MRKIFIILSCIWTVFSCMKEERLVLTSDGFEERELVPLHLKLAVEDYVDVVDGIVSAETKAAGTFAYDTVTANDRTIYNLWVLEFEQEGDQFVLNAQPTYVADYPGVLARNETVGVPASRRYCTLLFMANTGLPEMTFSPGTTLEQFKEARFAEIDHQSDLFGWDEHAGLYAPRFNGTYETYVNTSVHSIPGTADKEDRDTWIPLRRAMARIDINLVNASLQSTAVPVDQRITITHARINNVQNKSFYYTNYADYETSTTLNRPMTAAPLDATVYGYDWDLNTSNLTHWSSRMISYSNWYKNGEPYTIGSKTFPEAFADGAAPTEASARFFLPGNLRPENVLEATSVTLTGYYEKDGNRFEVSYDIPIRESIGGGKFIYAVRPNHKYTFNVTINRLGDTDVDEYADNGIVDFTNKELANCYILNPSNIEDVNKVFIFPVTKVNKYWGDPKYAGNQRVITSNYPAGAKTGSEVAIGENDVWQAFILWSDFDIRDKVSIVDLHHLNADGTSGGSEPGIGVGADAFSTGCFAVKVRGNTKGNVVVAVKRKIGNVSGSKDFILWSWHLWITDYNPDAEVNISPDKYLYQVNGGNVFRVNNYQFNTGKYRKSYLMDRVLGCIYDPRDLSTEYRGATYLEDLSPISESGMRSGVGFRYHFGRKDPIPHEFVKEIYYYYQDLGGGKFGPNYENPVKVTGSIKNQTSNWLQIFRGFSRLWGNYNMLQNTLYSIEGVDNSNQGQFSMVNSVIMYPLMHWGGDGFNNWTTNDVYDPSVNDENIMWQDPYFYQREDDDATNNLGYKKSIFDPCPPGWTIPSIEKVNNTVHYYLEGIDEGVLNLYKYWKPETIDGQLRGVLYWPDGREIPNAEITNNKIRTAVFIPRIGMVKIHLIHGTENSIREYLGNPGGGGSRLHGYLVELSGSQVRLLNDKRGNAYQVRCVKNVRPE